MLRYGTPAVILRCPAGTMLIYFSGQFMSDNTFIEKQKLTLESQLVELRAFAEISRHDADVVELDQSKIGRLSRMDAMQQQAMHAEQKRRRFSQIKRLAAALVRIEQDDYGWCQGCGKEINPQRLQIEPAAEYCTLCADKHQGS